MQVVRDHKVRKRQSSSCSRFRGERILRVVLSTEYALNETRARLSVFWDQCRFDNLRRQILGLLPLDISSSLPLSTSSLSTLTDRKGNQVLSRVVPSCSVLFVVDAVHISPSPFASSSRTGRGIQNYKVNVDQISG